ncbi:hypothetical protein HDU82_004567 [Entophlyctis luteolus]|nr:hypothetical protein HDU82_004567 [Entophlyctis luteolus]
MTLSVRALLLLLLAILLAAPPFVAAATYKDQQGRLEWHRPHIGVPAHTAVVRVHAGSRLMFASPDANTVAIVHPKNGSIVWRHLLADNDVLIHSKPLDSEVVASVSFHIPTNSYRIRTWSIASGFIIDDVSVRSDSSSSPCTDDNQRIVASRRLVAKKQIQAGCWILLPDTCQDYKKGFCVCNAHWPQTRADSITEVSKHFLPKKCRARNLQNCTPTGVLARRGAFGTAALLYKQIPHEIVPVSILNNEQRAAEYLAMNPAGLLPTLCHNGLVLNQSPAILEYLEEIFPSPPLMPADVVGRVKVRTLVFIVCCDTHPLQNTSVIKKVAELRGQQGSDLEFARWAILRGLAAYDKTVASTMGKFSYGDMLTMADLCLVAQCYNAVRFEVDLTPFPNVMKLMSTLSEVPCIKDSHPSTQPDAL